MSEPIFNAFQGLRVASVVRTADETSLATRAGRTLLALLRLSLVADDDLAWRTLLEAGTNGIGVKTIAAVEAIGDADGVSFSGAVAAIAAAPARISRGGSVKSEFEAAKAALTALGGLGTLDVADTIEAISAYLPASNDLTAARDELVGLARAYSSVADLAEFLTAIALKKEEEQSVVAGAVNIMTMHKAKGLDACVVFVPAAEEEMYVRSPSGRNEARRLFYVSITRAKRALFITHAVRRTGMQSRLGADPGAIRRRTTFLDTRGASRPGSAAVAYFNVDPASLA